MRKAALLLAILTLTCGMTQSHEPEDTEIISIKIAPGIERIIREFDLDVLMKKSGKLYAVTTSAVLARMQRKGFALEIETRRFPAASPSHTSVQSGTNGDFHSYREVEAELTDLEQSFPGLARKISIGTSLENRSISALKISDNVETDEGEPAVVFLGCHHAREWIAVEVPLLLARHLLSGYQSDPEIRRRIQQSEIWILPVVNPDGLEYSISVYRYWRKNRRDNGDGSFGVDLNRNYDFAWGVDDSGSSPDPDSGVFRGRTPFSEPESQAVRDLITDRDFRALISYHSFSQVILYPWGYQAAPSEQENLLQEIGLEMAARIHAVYGRTYDVERAGAGFYFTNGDTTDWAFGSFGIPAFTIELPPAGFEGGGFINAEPEIQIIFRENLPAAMYLIDWTIQTQEQSFPLGRVDPAGKENPGIGKKTKHLK